MISLIWGLLKQQRTRRENRLVVSRGRRSGVRVDEMGEDGQSYKLPVIK